MQRIGNFPILIKFYPITQKIGRHKFQFSLHLIHSITHTKVDGTDEIRESVNAKNQRLQIPIFSIAFGLQADFKFLSQISEMNKGFARRVYEDNDATLQVRKLCSLLQTYFGKRKWA